MSPTLQYILLSVLLLSAVVIVIAVLLQKSNEDGLSGTIAGGAETFYGRDKSAHTDRALYKWTLIASVIFIISVVAVYVFQPDFSASFSIKDWMSENLNNYSHVFPTEK